MEEETEEQQILESIEPAIAHLGFSIVEFKMRSVKGTYQIRLVIYRREGVSIEDCTQVHRTIRPKLEILLDSRELNIEVCSPGIGRTLKDDREYAIFVDQPVKILLAESTEWIDGVIESAEEEKISLKTAEGTKKIALRDIHKAKLI